MRAVNGLRARLVAAFTAVALMASVGASGLSYVLVRREMVQRAQETELTFLRETLTRTVPAELPPDVAGDLGVELAQALRTVDGRRKAYVRARGTEQDRPVPPPGALHAPVSPEFVERAMDELVFQRVVRDGNPYLLMGTSVMQYTGDPRTEAPVVLVSVNLEGTARELASFARSIALADGLALLAALVFALLASRGVLRPVRRLGGAARALGDGELSTRVSVHGQDELADLAVTFNRTAEALERMVTELRAKDAASRRFVADVSHELRTPLTAMVAATEVLAEETASAGDGGAAARLVAEETRRLGTLTEHLIEISRFDAGAALLVLDDVVVAEAVAATLAGRGWTDRIEVAGPACLVARLDPRRFDVIVANLAANALKHGRPPVRLCFAIASRGERDGLELTVTDDGPGIPAELLPVVFDRFVKAEAARSRSEGSGLGLSIARENAVLHGGTLEVANATGGGAVFTLWLPSAPEAGRVSTEAAS
ncbi:HAMP domain-containing sensor histidine kinase [Actinomadura fulvescens]|uniref:histidine kinase n=1 Tax=Actinomadura fulvescens TaxID=46160 RepID=A0ABP6BQM9_9ACTN